jgi:hypothetical protein
VLFARLARLVLCSCNFSPKTTSEGQRATMDMDTVCHQRNFYDLCYERKWRWYSRKLKKIGQPATPDMAATEDLNKRRSLRAISAWTFTRFYRGAMLSPLVLAMHTYSTSSPRGYIVHQAGERPLAPNRSDTNYEEVAIRARLAMAHDDSSTRLLINSLKQINQVILQSMLTRPLRIRNRLSSIESLTQARTLSTISIWASAVPDDYKIPISKSYRKPIFALM